MKTVIYRRLFVLAGSFLLLLPASTPAQTQQVRVIPVGDRDLKRTAYRLRLTYQQVRDARKALREALSLADSVEGWDVLSFQRLAGLWSSLDRRTAPDAIQVLFDELLQRARNPSTPWEYSRVTNTAKGLIRYMFLVTPGRAEDLIKRWPPPPPGNETEVVALQDEFQRLKLDRLVLSQPEQATALLSTLEDPYYVMRAQLAMSALGRGDRARAEDIVDESIVLFRSARPTLQTFGEFVTFLKMIAGAMPSRSREALLALAEQALEVSELEGRDVSVLTIDHQEIVLSPAENLLLDAIRNAWGMPQLSLQILDALPHLQVTLESAGGLDRVLMAQMGMASEEFGEGQSRLGLVYELLAKPSAVIRRELETRFDGAEEIDALVLFAQTGCWHDPNLGLQAIELALELLPDVERLDDRSIKLQRIASANQACEGQVEPELLEVGFELVKLIRKENETGTYQPQLDEQLEIQLISFWAGRDFKQALQYVHSRSSVSLRFRALIAMAGAWQRGGVIGG